MTLSVLVIERSVFCTPAKAVVGNATKAARSMRIGSEETRDIGLPLGIRVWNEFNLDGSSWASPRILGHSGGLDNESLRGNLQQVKI